MVFVKISTIRVDMNRRQNFLRVEFILHFMFYLGVHKEGGLEKASKDVPFTREQVFLMHIVVYSACVFVWQEERAITLTWSNYYVCNFAEL